MTPPKDECPRDEDFRRLYALIEKVFTQMDNFISELHKTNLSDVSRENRISVLERDASRMHSRHKDIKNDLKELNDWRQRFSGSIKTMLAIPVFCTVVTTIIAIYKILSG